MATGDAEFLKKLLAMFKLEAREHLNVISHELTRMAKEGPAGQPKIVETMFREAHSLKGAASSVNLGDVVSLCQSIENVFSALKSGRMHLLPQTIDLLHQVVDFCYRLIETEQPSASERAAAKALAHQLNGSISQQVTPEAEQNGIHGQGPRLRPGNMPDVPPTEPAVSDTSTRPPVSVATSAIPATVETIRISTATLDALLLQAEEMITVKLANGQRLAELRDLHKVFASWKKERQRQRSNRTPAIHHSSESLSTDIFMASFDSRLSMLAKSAEDDHRTSAALIDMLLVDMKKTLMLPFSSMLEMFPLFVRDLARAGGKRVEMTIEGGDIEVDRRVLEELKDPLIHLVRNCLDHGIEPPEERVKNRKSAYGKITIGITSRDSKIEIAVSDDGRGIDAARIVSSAIKQAVIQPEAAEKLGEQEALQLLFQSGVTTSPIITDISGRGLGLPIVSEKVEKLNGSVTIATRKGEGTTFRMVVPLTLATFRGTIVRVAEHLFILPSTAVERVARVRLEMLQTVENRETLVIDGQPLSLVRLGDVLDLQSAGHVQQAEDPFVHVVVAGTAERRIAFAVDDIIGEQEILVKPLSRQLARVRNILGATVLGDGRVVPVLNIPDLLKNAVQKAPSFTTRLASEPTPRISVLVAEDSITARTLLKNILVSAGYDVQTVVDGIDALAALRSRTFDIVVSDVEMPRMNGFDLTAKIRSDRKMAEIPVVLVTALESREDRERGIDVGANAYIVKSSFDQSNLLDVIGRLA